MHSRRAILCALSAAAAHAQSYVPKQSDRPERQEGDGDGFKPIFDGKTLQGWDGDPKYWRVADGAITGEITPETVVKSNTFIIWNGGQPKDFELKLDYKITGAGNSGINYRSIVIPDPVTPSNRFAMRGYQCDIDGQNRYTGQNYEEKGRLFHALRGQVTRRVEGRKPILLSTFPDPKDAITPDWNAVHLIIRGNTLIHMINGQLMSMVIDDDPAGRKMEGQIGVQVHVGPPMKVQYRNLRLKNL
jgi:hypothetical protein